MPHFGVKIKGLFSTTVDQHTQLLLLLITSYQWKWHFQIKRSYKVDIGQYNEQQSSTKTTFKQAVLFTELDSSQITW